MTIYRLAAQRAFTTSSLASQKEKSLSEKAAEVLQKGADAFKTVRMTISSSFPSQMCLYQTGSIGSKFNADGQVGGKANEGVKVASAAVSKCNI